MTLALRAVIVGLAVALMIDWAFSPNVIALFGSFIVGMAFGLLISWVSWPWMDGPE